MTGDNVTVSTFLSSHNKVDQNAHLNSESVSNSQVSDDHLPPNLLACIDQITHPAIVRTRSTSAPTA